MRSNFELWKEGNLPMFIASFTINGESGADNITYSDTEAKEYLSKC